jgi:hypothetical protein
VWMQWHFKMQELKRLRSVTKKIVLRWENVKYARTFMRWVEQTAEQRRLRLTSTKVVKRWMHGVLAAVWMQWVGKKDKQMRLRNMLSQVTKRWKCGCLWSAFERWTDICRSEPTAVKVSLDLDFETTAVSPDDKAKFERQLRLDICSSLGLHTEDLVIICNQTGSVVSTVVFLRPASEALAQEFAAHVADSHSSFHSTPLGKHVKDVAVRGPVSKDALDAIIAAKNEDETRRAYQAELDRRREEVQRSIKVRRALIKYLNRNICKALRTWDTYLKAQKHKSTVRFKISKHKKRRTIHRAWASWRVFTQFMIDFKNLGPKLDDEYFAKVCDEDSRMWTAALDSHESFERQLLEHQRRRFWEESKLIAHRKTPKLLQHAGDCDTPDTVSVFSAEVKPPVHARDSSQRATPLFAALSNPLDLIPGTPGYRASARAGRQNLSKTSLQKEMKAAEEKSPPPHLPPTAIRTPSPPPPLPPRPGYVTT